MNCTVSTMLNMSTVTQSSDHHASLVSMVCTGAATTTATVTLSWACTVTTDAVPPTPTPRCTPMVSGNLRKPTKQTAVFYCAGILGCIVPCIYALLILYVLLTLSSLFLSLSLTHTHTHTHTYTHTHTHTHNHSMHTHTVRVHAGFFWHTHAHTYTPQHIRTTHTQRLNSNQMFIFLSK